jgi:signal transduction histidine kinase
MARHVGVHLVIARPPPAGELLAGDRQSLVQMLVNLLVNAVEAAAKTRVTATLGSTTDEQAVVSIDCECGETDCNLIVSDPGPGPAAAIQSRLFEPFATDKPGGTGLGLVVSRRIAEDHGGTLRWERRADETRFIVTLPRRKARRKGFSS